MSRETRKDRSLQRYLIWEFGVILPELYTDNQHFRGKFTANFAFLLLPFPGKISYFPGKLTSWNSVGKEDDKVGNKTRYRKEGKRRIKIDLQANYNKQTIKQTTTTNQVQIFGYGYVPKTNWWSLITKKISQKILACSAVVFFRRANILARESAILKLQSFSVMKSKMAPTTTRT